MSTTLPLPPLESDIKVVSLESTILRLENLINTQVVGPDLAGKCAALATSLRREVRTLKATTPLDMVPHRPWSDSLCIESTPL